MSIRGQGSRSKPLGHRLLGQSAGRAQDSRMASNWRGPPEAFPSLHAPPHGDQVQQAPLHHSIPRPSNITAR